MSVNPSIVYTSSEPPRHILSVWPPIPGVTDNPVIQIDHGKDRHAVVEFRREDAEAICEAIRKAAAKQD